MIKDLTEGKLLQTLIFARSIKDDSLIDCLSNLNKWLEEEPEIRIVCDRAKHSFYFVRKIGDTVVGNGGIIYHGKHDNGGDGSEPTFSVNLTPTNGWQIHT